MLLFVLTFAIHAALASVAVLGLLPYLRKLPKTNILNRSWFSWLLLVPLLDVIVLWTLMIHISRTYDATRASGTSSLLPHGIAIAVVYTLIGFAIDFSWAMVVVLVLLSGYKKRLFTQPFDSALSSNEQKA